MRKWGTAEILAPGESERLVAEMQKLCRVEQSARSHACRAAWLPISNACACCRQALVPSFDAKVRRKDGVQIPVTLHISALRDARAS